MLQALLREARIWQTIWRRRLSTYRLLHAQDSLPFLVMLGVPVLCIAGIIIFAYVVDPASRCRHKRSQAGTSRARTGEKTICSVWQRILL